MTVKKYDMDDYVGVEADECPRPDCDGDTVRVIVGFPTAKCDSCGWNLN